MNSTTRKAWNQNASKDTVASAGVIVAGLLVVITAALSAYSDAAPLDRQIADQQKVDGRTAGTVTRLKVAI
jgi:hypothetical protein